MTAVKRLVRFWASKDSRFGLKTVAAVFVKCQTLQRIPAILFFRLLCFWLANNKHAS